LTLLLPIAVFLAVRALPTERVLLLIKVLLGVAALQATLGLMQFGGGRESGLYLGMTFTHFDSAVGTYTNRNHLAGLMEMMLPVTLALLLYSVGRNAPEASAAGHRQRWRRRLSFFSGIRGHAAFAYGTMALLVLVGVIFSRSRAGIALSILGVLLAVGLFARRVGGTNVYGPVGTLAVIAVGLGVAIGLVPVLDRFSVEGALADARWSIFSATLDGIGAFFPLGSGPGTFPEVFPSFQPVELGRWFINRAHNDYLEWLFEGGIGAALLMLLLAGLYLFQWGKILKPSAWSRLRFVQIGAGIGLLLLALHELVDYNLHTPANIVYFAFLAGIFFADSERDPEGQRGKSPRRTPRMDLAGRVTPASGVVTPAAPAADQIRNPFLD
jgi:O-antigen ligase